ncbi:MAG: metallophosphoesterase [Anaerolineae bacterium]
MQIETQPNIHTGVRTRTRRHSRHQDKIVDALLKLPIQVLNALPFFAMEARREARCITLTRMSLTVDNLPRPFEGLKLAFLTDFHSGPTTPADFLKRVVDETNRENPDVVLLGGDYITLELAYLSEIGEALRRLHAPLGVYGVLGNHDYWQDANAVHHMLETAGVVDVTNAGRWLHRENSRIRIAGIGDLWEDLPDLHTAVGGAHETEPVILLSHNPDYAMELQDPRVKVVLSGHTHGGQICLPKIGPVITNSKYGKRVASGHVQFDSFQVYTSRGLGTVVAPFRYNCPPEVAVFTLRGSPPNELRRLSKAQIG